MFHYSFLRSTSVPARVQNVTTAITKIPKSLNCARIQNPAALQHQQRAEQSRNFTFFSFKNSKTTTSTTPFALHDQQLQPPPPPPQQQPQQEHQQHQEQAHHHVIGLLSGFSPAHPLVLQLPAPSTYSEVVHTLSVLISALVIVGGILYLHHTNVISLPTHFNPFESNSDNGKNNNNKNNNKNEKGGAGGGDDEVGVRVFVPRVSSSKTFADVKGCDEAVEELRHVVEYLREPSRFTRLGGKLPKGILLTGPPGTGKTLLSKAVSGEAQVHFIAVSGSEFDEMYVGVGASRVRQLFATARQYAPCIVFIDEIDAIGGKRNPRDTQASRMTLNQLLVELDGFEGSSGILVLAATNFPELLDSALTRPGRFDQHVQVQPPDKKGREQILLHYLSSVKVNASEQGEIAHVMAQGTPGFTGAELENLVNTASLHAISRNATSITLQHLEHAREKILMGAEKKTFRTTASSRACTAHHEAGHALVASLLANTGDPVYKATILARGNSLGMVQQLPRDDQYHVDISKLRARLEILMAGRVAEELLLGPEDYTSGASSDLEHATRIARNMVTHWAMGDRVGHMYLGDVDTPASPALQKIVDEEVENILKKAYTQAKSTILKHRTAHLAVANALLEHETLTGAQILEVIEKAESQQPHSEEESSTVHHNHHTLTNKSFQKHPISGGMPVPNVARV